MVYNLQVSISSTFTREFFVRTSFRQLFSNFDKQDKISFFPQRWFTTCRCQFHQHLRVSFLYERRFGSFFLSMYVPMYVKKAVETTYLLKTRARLTLMKLTADLTECCRIQKIGYTVETHFVISCKNCL